MLSGRITFCPCLVMFSSLHTMVNSYLPGSEPMTRQICLQKCLEGSQKQEHILEQSQLSYSELITWLKLQTVANKESSQMKCVLPCTLQLKFITSLFITYILQLAVPQQGHDLQFSKERKELLYRFWKGKGRGSQFHSLLCTSSVNPEWWVNVSKPCGNRSWHYIHTLLLIAESWHFSTTECPGSFWLTEPNAFFYIHEAKNSALKLRSS